MSSSDEIIEHVVLLNIKDGDEDPSMVNALNSLNSLDEVVYLSAGPILRTRSSPDDLKFTHMLHARFRFKSDLSAYLAHPAHVSLAALITQGQDLLAVDWAVVGLDGPVIPRPGSALRLTLFKLRSDSEEEEVIREIELGLERIKEKSGGPFEQISYGQNFSPESGKGYGVASLVVFPDLNELDASEEYEDQMCCLIHKVKSSLHLPALIAVDYLVPRPPPL